MMKKQIVLLGLQVTGKYWDEETILRLACIAESFVHRRKPENFYSLLPSKEPVKQDSFYPILPPREDGGDAPAQT
eukprot:TRINITY_DN12603_c0_g1_i1.p1 TRINITY_DN12603_c0_g1~~TRINITY_DN12603_c0_g1_i1.p1  ORF type:complete len:75 (+),score=15.67 TRINITY_DN12603_c0_g1_i1:39-263(+)